MNLTKTNIVFLKNTILLSIILVTISCSKQKDNVPTYNSTLKILVSQHNLNLKPSRVGYDTDSIQLTFTTNQLYDCDRYRINYTNTNEDATVKLTMHNIHRIGGYCSWLPNPASAVLKTNALQNGTHKFVVEKNNKSYEGKIVVKNNTYSFNWLYDEVLNIEPKTFTL